MLLHVLCGSRKYPYPPNRRSLEIVRGRGDSKAVISEGRGGFMGLFQRVMNRVQNIESNV